MSWMVEYETKREVGMIPNRMSCHYLRWGSQGGAYFRRKIKNFVFGHVEMSINPSGDFGKAVDK